MFSRRAQWNPPINRLAAARAARGPALLDLTGSNPTTAGIPYPLEELEEILAEAARVPYDPQPLGIAPAREAVARHLECDPADIVITASTSEAYSFLFKLLTDPGDEILTPVPSYPLLEHLAQLEWVTLRHFPLEFHSRWELDATRLLPGERTRAIVVVNPNNPTGSFVTPAEQDALARLGLPVISDEVFLGYPLSGSGRSMVRDDVLTFALGGLSKSRGLPHYKLGWIRVSGPGREDALNALELIADNFLSVSTPVQAALPRLLAMTSIHDAIAARTAASFEALTALLASRPAAQLLPVEGGWTAVIRVPRVMSDEEFALRALEEHGVLVHPGYFFDFERDGYFVVSLLTPPELLREGVSRIV
jgi:aspartate/methionine/tyrosine aminotransferase